MSLFRLLCLFQHSCRNSTYFITRVLRFRQMSLFRLLWRFWFMWLLHIKAVLGRSQNTRNLLFPQFQSSNDSREKNVHMVTSNFAFMITPHSQHSFTCLCWDQVPWTCPARSSRLNPIFQLLLCASTASCFCSDEVVASNVSSKLIDRHLRLHLKTTLNTKYLVTCMKHSLCMNKQKDRTLRNAEVGQLLWLLGWWMMVLVQPMPSRSRHDTTLHTACQLLP